MIALLLIPVGIFMTAAITWQVRELLDYAMGERWWGPALWITFILCVTVPMIAGTVIGPLLLAGVIRG